MERVHEDQHKANEGDLLAASEAITGLFHKFGCGETPMGGALLATGLTERNVQQFLGLIEDQLVELLQLDSHINASKASKGDPTRPKTPKFTREGKRLPAMVLPDLNDVQLALTTETSEEVEPDESLAAVPIDPAKWLQSLKDPTNQTTTPRSPRAATGGGVHTVRKPNSAYAANQRPSGVPPLALERQSA